MDFSLRAEIQIFAASRDVKRLDAHAVARQHQPPVRFGPQRDGKHAAQARKAARVPFQKGVQNGLGIGGGSKVVSGLLQFGAQFGVVVNLAVEGDDRIAAGVRHGLIAAHQVSNLQTGSADRDPAATQKPPAGPAPGAQDHLPPSESGWDQVGAVYE